MANVQTIERHQSAAPTDLKKVLFTALIGAIVGAVAWGGGFLISRFIIEPVFCATPDSAAICQIRDTTSFNVALVVATFAGLLIMIRARVYRPLLIAIAAAISVWGLVSFVAQDIWVVRLLSIVLITSLAYAFYGLVAQLRSFIAAMIIAVLVVVGLRIIPTL